MVQYNYRNERGKRVKKFLSLLFSLVLLCACSSQDNNVKSVVNLSNIEKVYTDDPRKNPDAKPIDSISWKDFRKMVGDEWTPGKNCPFDPIASKKADECGMTVICASGKNIANIKAILNDEAFVGTKIG